MCVVCIHKPKGRRRRRRRASSYGVLPADKFHLVSPFLPKKEGCVSYVCHGKERERKRAAERGIFEFWSSLSLSGRGP